ncbi:MAG: winged helix-turn-helix domain-containing protein [bacterium]|nr:winged helix-turn-helix domain-containing protein [bacterium]
MSTVRFEALYPATSREAEIGKVLGFVRAGLSCQIIGVPGVGRSNLLGLLAFNHNVRTRHLGEEQKNYHFIYLNFAEVKNAPPSEINKFLFLHLLESLEEREYQEALEKIQSLFKDALSSGEPMILWQSLKKAVDILTNSLGLSLILLFDRFEEYRSVDSEFFLNLRTLRSLAKYRFAVIFALSHPLEKTLEPEVYKEFYEFLVGHLVYLPLYDPPGVEFRLSHLGKTVGKKLTPKNKSELLTLTGGHGKLTKVGAEAILSSPRPAGDKNGVSEKFLSSQPDVRAALFEISQSLTGGEKALLQKIASGQRVGEDEAVAFLLAADLVRKSGQSFKLTVPLLVSFLKAPAQATNAKIYFRPETNEILKGDQVISDGLTAQEFRLLKFLLENPGRVCEREEIINAVWPDSKSTSGISDEAIDQMIFRLRRKTEADPKNSKHLQTVKGRGFRFGP